MFNTKNIDELSFCTSVLYKSNKDYSCDYSTLPRPCHNFLFMLEGSGTILVKNSVITIKKGDILYIPQNSTYISKWKANPNCVFHSVHFKFSLSRDPFLYKKIAVQKLENQQFERLYDEVKNIQRYQTSKSFDSYFYLSAFYRLCGELLPSVKIENDAISVSGISPAITYLENNYVSSCTIEQLSSLCCLSPSRFFHLFKKNVGCSPMTYKNRILIQKASQTLLFHKDKSIEDVAFEYGFISPIYFRRLFKKLTGKTPSQYRKETNLI